MLIRVCRKRFMFLKHSRVVADLNLNSKLCFIKRALTEKPETGRWYLNLQQHLFSFGLLVSFVFDWHPTARMKIKNNRYDVLLLNHLNNNTYKKETTHIMFPFFYGCFDWKRNKQTMNCSFIIKFCSRLQAAVLLLAYNVYKTGQQSHKTVNWDLLPQKQFIKLTLWNIHVRLGLAFKWANYTYSLNFGTERTDAWKNCEDEPLSVLFCLVGTV